MIAIGPQIPGLGNQLDLSQYRILSDSGKEAAVAGQCGSQIAFTAAEMMDSSEKLACGYLGHGTLPSWAGGNTARTSKFLL
jgi:hypothetical protein